MVVVLAAVAGTICLAAAIHADRKWRACRDDTAPCFDPASGTVHDADPGLGWLVLGLAWLGIAAYQLWRLRRG